MIKMLSKCTYFSSTMLVFRNLCQWDNFIKTIKHSDFCEKFIRITIKSAEIIRNDEATINNI